MFYSANGDFINLNKSENKNHNLNEHFTQSHYNINPTNISNLSIKFHDNKNNLKAGTKINKDGDFEIWTGYCYDSNCTNETGHEKKSLKIDKNGNSYINNNLCIDNVCMSKNHFKMLKGLTNLLTPEFKNNSELAKYSNQPIESLPDDIIDKLLLQIGQTDQQLEDEESNDNVINNDFFTGQYGTRYGIPAPSFFYTYNGKLILKGINNFEARYIRLYPIEWTIHPSMEYGFYFKNNQTIETFNLMNSFYPFNYNLSNNIIEQFDESNQTLTKWSSNKPSVGEYLQIDLGSKKIINGIKIFPRSEPDYYSHKINKFTIAYSNDNNNYQPYNFPLPTIFTTNKGVIDLQSSFYPINAQFIKFHIIDWNIHPSMRFDVYVDNILQDTPESQRSYSGTFNNDESGTGHSQSTLNSNKAWSGKADNDDRTSNIWLSSDQWAQLDLGSIKNITGIKILNRADDLHSTQYVNKFSIEYSEDGKNYTPYEHKIPIKIKTSKGYFNLSKMKPIQAQFFKIYTLEWNNNNSMRIDLYVDGIIQNTPENKRSYSSIYENNTNDSNFAKSSLSSVQAWSGNNKNSDYIKLDLGKIQNFTGLKILPRSDNKQHYVKQFFIEYSNDDVYYEKYNLDLPNSENYFDFIPSNYPIKINNPFSLQNINNVNIKSAFMSGYYISDGDGPRKATVYPISSVNKTKSLIIFNIRNYKNFRYRNSIQMIYVEIYLDIENEINLEIVSARQKYNIDENDLSLTNVLNYWINSDLTIDIVTKHNSEGFALLNLEFEFDNNSLDEYTPNQIISDLPYNLLFKLIVPKTKIINNGSYVKLNDTQTFTNLNNINQIKLIKSQFGGAYISSKNNIPQIMKDNNNDNLAYLLSIQDGQFVKMIYIEFTIEPDNLLKIKNISAGYKTDTLSKDKDTMFNFWNNKTNQLYAISDTENGYGLKNIEIEIITQNIPNELNVNGLIGWFDAESYDSENKLWLDKSGNGNHANIEGNIQIVERNENDNKKSNKVFKYLQGTNTSRVSMKNIFNHVTDNGTKLGSSSNSSKYTFLHFTRYIDNTKGINSGRIWNGGGNINYLSGHHHGSRGAYYQNGWIVNYSNDNSRTDWLLTTEQNVYKGGRIRFYPNKFNEISENNSGAGNLNNLTNWVINPSNNTNSEFYGSVNQQNSKWACAVVLFFNRHLNNDEIIQIETYLKNKYIGDLPIIPKDPFTYQEVTSNQGFYMSYYRLYSFWNNNYYRGNSIGSNPNLIQNRQINYNWRNGSVQGKSYNYIWIEVTGHIMPPVTGNYEFSLGSDDGSKLYINSNKVIDNWGVHGTTYKNGFVNMVMGKTVSFKIVWFEKNGGATMYLKWKIPGSNLEIIPSKYFLKNSIDLKLN